MITKLTTPVPSAKHSEGPDDPSTNSGLRIYPGPVLPDSLNEIVAVAQNLGANILEIPDGAPVILELAGPATIILAQPADFSWKREEPGHRGKAVKEEVAQGKANSPLAP